MAGPLALGVIPTLGPYLLPWLVPLLKRAYPDARLILCEDLTDDLIERLRSHRIDAALLALPIPAPDLEIRALFDEPFLFACPRDHPLARAQTVSDVNLRSEMLLLLTDGHCLRDQALAVCGQRRAPIEDDAADLRATSLETLCQVVAVGLGVTLLPALAATRPDRHSFAIRPLASGASRRIALVWRRSYPKGADLDGPAALIRDGLPPAVQAASPGSISPINRRHSNNQLAFVKKN